MSIDRAALRGRDLRVPACSQSSGETTQVPQYTPSVANKADHLRQGLRQRVLNCRRTSSTTTCGVWAKTVSDLAMKARISRDSNAFKIFRGAFTTTLTADGAALIGASHTLLNGETCSNLVSGALSPSTPEPGDHRLAPAEGPGRRSPRQRPSVPGRPVRPLQRPSDHQVRPRRRLREQQHQRVPLRVQHHHFYLPVSGRCCRWLGHRRFLLAKNHSITRMIRPGSPDVLMRLITPTTARTSTRLTSVEGVPSPDYIGTVGSTLVSNANQAWPVSL